MPDYSKANVYKLCCNDTNITDIYIGSSCNLTKRKYHHRSSCNNEKSKKYNMCVYRFIRDNGGWNNWDMIRLEKFSCEDKHEMRQKEREWIEKLKPTLNRNIPNRTKEEYRECNKEKIKEYYQDNKEKFKTSSKKYYEDNKEKILEEKKQYYEKNKDKIKQKNKKKSNCPHCDKEMLKSSLSRHIKNYCKSIIK